MCVTKQAIVYPPPRVAVQAPAADFTTGAVVDGEIKSLTLSDYKGKWVVLFFYPKASRLSFSGPPRPFPAPPTPTTSLLAWFALYRTSHSCVLLRSLRTRTAQRSSRHWAVR